MGYQDRNYSRNPGGSWHPLMWLLAGSVHLFTVFGINVRAHASLIILSGLVLIFGLPGFTRNDSVIFVSTLFVVILLHEFGHCFGARIMGGEASEITMSPLGGLAYAMAPRRPLATFVTVAAGPLVNVILMLISAVIIYGLRQRPAWWPYDFGFPAGTASWMNLYWYVSWFFQINYALLLFNLLPIFPLDGGQLLQSILWRPLGYYRSMLYTLTIALVGSVLMAMVAISSGHFLLFFIALSCFMTSYPARIQVKQAGPWGFTEEETDYAAASWSPPRVNAKAEAREQRRLEREAAAERAEQEKIDRILEKVHRNGMHSLSFFEKRALKNATERQRQRTLNRRR